MNKELPQVTCPKCHLTQAYRGQRNCIHKGCEWSNWDIAMQLKVPYGAGNTTIPLPEGRFYACEACGEDIQEMPILDRGFFFHEVCWLRRRIAEQEKSRRLSA